MSQYDDKRRQRELKRSIKKAGNRKRRQHLKRSLQGDPAEAADAEFDFGRDSSAGLNGVDRDATRRRADGKEDSPQRHKGHKGNTEEGN